MPATKHITTARVNADQLASNAQLDVCWPTGARVASTIVDDAYPWMLRVIVESTLADGQDLQLEHRALRGYRDGDPVPIDSTYLGTVVDGPAQSLHIYEVNDMAHGNYCHRCKCAMRFVRMEETGRAMPIDPQPDPEGTVAARQDGPGRLVGYVISKAHPLQEGYTLYRAHFDLCGRIADVEEGAATHRTPALTDLDDALDDQPATPAPKLRLSEVL